LKLHEIDFELVAMTETVIEIIEMVIGLCEIAF